ncbi:MAG: hypothetical protein PHO37_16300 [Kiritimatiellae bacterium]|nr:hypothetical protein [Kiritimatiellia bacterium]
MGGTLTFVTNSVAKVMLGAADTADTISLGALYLESDFALEMISPGVCDKLILTAQPAR